MSDIFEAGLQALKQTLAGIAKPVVYTHNGIQYDIAATRGSINWATLNKLGDVALGEDYRDYIIDAAALPFEPVKGDTIQDAGEMFELYAETSNSKCYRYSDTYKQLIRVYTRRVKDNVT